MLVVLLPHRQPPGFETVVAACVLTVVVSIVDILGVSAEFSIVVCIEVVDVSITSIVVVLEVVDVTEFGSETKEE